MGAAATTLGSNLNDKHDAAAIEAAVGPELWAKHGKAFFEANADADGKVTGTQVATFAAANGLLPKSDKPYEAPKVETKYFHDVLASMPSMEGKTVAITGTTSGTGAVLAEAMAKKGAKVILLNRPSSRSQAALEKIQAAAGDASKAVHIDCDLQSFKSVRAAGAALLALDAPLDVLVGNAGVMALKDVATEDGCDVQMQTNHLSHFLLTSLAWPLLEKAAAANGQARVVQHSSGARTMGGGFDAKYYGKNGGNLGGDESNGNFTGGRWVRYAQTKLANIGFCLALADRVSLQPAGSPASKILSLCAHPGLAATNLQVVNAKDDETMHATYQQFMNTSQSAEDGTLGILRAACDPAEEIVAGSLLGPVERTGPAVVMDAAAEQARFPVEARQAMWAVSLETTGAADFLVPPAATADATADAAKAAEGADAAKAE